jgi:enamine deaminase RidA (YjgF/YER057c/UK114 family)
MHKYANPETMPKPVGRYSHTVEVAPGARWLHVSGQLGMTPDGKLAEGFAAQCEQAFKNVLAAMAAAGMGEEDLVKLTVLTLSNNNLTPMREVRDRLFSKVVPASTLIVCAGLAKPEYLVEVEAIAAKVDAPARAAPKAKAKAKAKAKTKSAAKAPKAKAKAKAKAPKAKAKARKRR